MSRRPSRPHTGKPFHSVMKEISVTQIRDAVATMCKKANFELKEDMPGGSRPGRAAGNQSPGGKYP